MISQKKIVFKMKQELRQTVWTYMEDHNLVAFPRPCFGRIPNFVGSQTAAKRMKTLMEWKEARLIFSAPDSSLQPARYEALKEGKALLVAAPRMKGFYLLKGIHPKKATEASRIRGFSKFGRPVKLRPHLDKIDLFLTGAVAVDKKGNRIGKGTGYGDREDDALSKARLMDEWTPRVALVHEVQVFDDFSFLMGETDRRVQIIVTPNEIYRIK